MKITFSFLILLFIISACTNESEIVNNSKLEITTISDANSFVYDTITVFGTGFTNDNLELNTSEQLEYELIRNTSTEIVFVPLSSTEPVELSIIANDEESNSISFKVSKTPSYDTSFVESGSFKMGSITGFSDESPVHEVTLTKDLYVFSYEVTNLLWHHVMDTIITPIELRDFPKDSISWNSATLFANKLSEIYGLDPVYTIENDLVSLNSESNGWRLPTEAEWEYICKGSSEEDFSGNGNINDMGFYDSNSGLNKHRVGEKNPNNNGLYDIHGNLWEWCWDFYSETTYTSNSQTNPTGPNNGARHVIRGGSYQDGFNYARSTNRSIKKLDLNSIGLRLVRNAN